MCSCPREGVCVCVRVSVSLCVWECLCSCEGAHVSLCEGIRVCVRMSMSVCVWENVHVCVCVRTSMSVSVWGCSCLREGVHVDQRRAKGPLELEIQAVGSPWLRCWEPDSGPLSHLSRAPVPSFILFSTYSSVKWETVNANLRGDNVPTEWDNTQKIYFNLSSHKYIYFHIACVVISIQLSVWLYECTLFMCRYLSSYRFIWHSAGCLHAPYSYFPVSHFRPTAMG